MCLEAALYEGRVNVKTYQGGIADPEFYEGQNSEATGRRVRNRTRKSERITAREIRLASDWF